MMMKSLCIAIIASLFSVNQAQTIRSQYNSAELVVLAEVVGVYDGDQGYTFRRHRPDDRTPMAIKVVRINVLEYLKGAGEAQIDVAVPADMISPSRYQPSSRGVATATRTKAVWFLQRAEGDGVFFFTWDERLPGSREYSNSWRAPGQRFALNDLMRNLPTIVVLDAEPAPGIRGCLRIAEAIARSVSVESRFRDFYLSLLQDLRPVPGNSYQPELNLQGAELQAWMDWLDTRFPLLVSFPTAQDRLNELALRLTWGQRQYAGEFLDLFMALPDGSLRIFFPSDTAFRTVDDILRVLPRINDPMGARGMVLGLVYFPDRRLDITRVVISLFGRNHYLDAGILECLAALWSRPDLSPFDGVHIRDDLSQQIARAHRLPRR